jgi:hypothetical protein
MATKALKHASLFEADNTQNNCHIKKKCPVSVHKTINNSIKKEPITKVVTTYRHLRTGDQLPITELGIATIATDLFNWALTSKHFNLTFFCAEAGIPRFTFYRWMEAYPELKEAYEEAKEVIGARREEGGLTRQLDGNLVAKSMPLYSQAWAKMEADRDERRKPLQNSGVAGNITVLMERFEDKIETPKKKDKE